MPDARTVTRDESHEDRLIEDLVVRCLGAKDRALELAAVAREHPLVHSRVAEVLARVTADDRVLFGDGARRTSAAAPPQFDATLVPASDVHLPVPPPRSENRFGRFRILQCLGQGGMGAVYRAFDEQLRREVALKQIRGEALLQPQFRQRFVREAQAASRLDHRNLCTVYDSGEIDGVPFIAMQLVEGTSLDKHIAAAARGTSPLLPGMAMAGSGGQPLLPRTRGDFDCVAAFFETLARAWTTRTNAGSCTATSSRGT